MLSAPIKNNRLTIILMLILIGLLAMVVVWIKYYQSTGRQLLVESSRKTLPSPVPTPTPTPIILKPDEGTKGNYTVSQNAKDTDPRFSKVTFDPLDVQQGQNLTITVTLSSQSPVSAVTGTLTGDTMSTPVTLQKNSETAGTSIWSATIPITDTLLYKYILKLEAVNGTGTSSVTVAPRS